MKQHALAVAAWLVPAVALAGGKPTWIEGKDPRYKPQEYLVAVGYGPQRSMAESSAMANISKIFEAAISSSMKDYQASFTGGKQALEVQSVEQLTQVSTKKTLQGVKIIETYDDKGTIYALAVLQRAPAAATLRERIGELDKTVDAEIDKASATDDKMKKVTSLRKAAKALQERMAANEELRVVSPDGQGIPAEHSAADIASQVESASDELTIGAQCVGTAASDLCQALVDGLTQAGFQVTAMPAPSDDEDEEEEDSGTSFDLIIRAKSKMENATVNEGSGPKLARVNVDVELFNVAKKKVISTFNSSKKEGHNNIEEAARRAVRSMKADLVKKIQEAIQKKLGPK